MRLGTRLGTHLPILLAALLAAACARFLPQPVEQPVFLSLDPPPAQVPGAAHSGPTVLVDVPRAAPGFDSHRMIYLRMAHRREYYSRHQWIDPPARMLAPLIVASLERTGVFHAVLLAPVTAAADLRLATEDVRLQQEFFAKPSRVRLSLRALLVDNATRRVLAQKSFEAVVDAPSDDPYGGAVAANEAAARVLGELAGFVARFVAESGRGPQPG